MEMELENLLDHGTATRHNALLMDHCRRMYRGTTVVAREQDMESHESYCGREVCSRQTRRC